jgi:hypothetical protein
LRVFVNYILSQSQAQADGPTMMSLRSPTRIAALPNILRVDGLDCWTLIYTCMYVSL